MIQLKLLTMDYSSIFNYIQYRMEHTIRDMNLSISATHIIDTPVYCTFQRNAYLNVLFPLTIFKSCTVFCMHSLERITTHDKRKYATISLNKVVEV